MTAIRRRNMAVGRKLDPFGREVEIYGQAEASSSTTDGHAEAMNKKVNDLVTSGEYRHITLQRSWRTATGRVNESRLIPDTIAVRRDGRVDAWEVQSKTDDLTTLFARLKTAMGMLDEARRGKMDALPPMPSQSK
jgi:hypothetical protein